MSDRTFYATTYVVADGVTRTWAFSFAGVNTGQSSGTTPYLYPEDVKVQELFTDAAGNKQVTQRTGTLTAPNQITIDGPAVQLGREIRIYRETELRFPLVDYRDLQSVSEHDLDLANRQAVFIAQETRDSASANLMYDKQGHFNANDRRIVNLAPGIDPKDAVNMDQFLHTVRAPDTEGHLVPLPVAADRALKLMAFDLNGNPVAVHPSSQTATALQDKLYDETDPRNGAAMLGRGTVTVNSMFDLRQQVQRTGLTFVVAGYWPEHRGHGGGCFEWDATMPRTKHDGGKVLSPTVPWDGSQGGHRAFQAGTGETAPAALGCFVRRAKPTYYVTDFGAISDWKAGAGFGTGFNNQFVFMHMLINVAEPIEVPKWGTGYAINSNIAMSNVFSRSMTGVGHLVKTGTKGVFEFSACADIHLGAMSVEMQVEADEAAAGSILNSSRPPANYSFAVSLARCPGSSVRGMRVSNSSWDAIVAQGRVFDGGLTSEQQVDVVFDNCTVSNVRGSMLWMRAVKKGLITRNRCHNDKTFIQKANGIFAVEWCDDVEISGNQCYNIGDNAIGVGQPVTKHDNSRNKNIRVVNNYSYRTRYHSILIAQGQDCLVEGNIVLRGGVQKEMPGVSTNVLCGGITVLGGVSEPPNHRVIVRNNIVRDSYEIGIYAVDRPGTSVTDGSTNIIIEGNVVSRTARPDFVGTRKGSDSIRVQLRNTCSVKDNVTTDGAGDGVKVYGDAILQGNHSYFMDGIGLHIPSDTLVNNRRLSGAVANNVSMYCGSTGIRIWGKDFVSLIGNTAVGNGRKGAPGTEETTVGATARAGIALVEVVHVSASGNELRSNGGPGIVYRACTTVRDMGSTYADNGDMFTTGQYQSGVYAEGTKLAPQKLLLIAPIFLSTGVQKRPAYLSAGDPTSVVIDPVIENHSLGLAGITQRSFFNIPTTAPTGP